MTNWIQTKAGLQMAETIIRYLPRITVCLEEIAKESKIPLLSVNIEDDKNVQTRRTT